MIDSLRSAWWIRSALEKNHSFFWRRAVHLLFVKYKRFGSAVDCSKVNSTMMYCNVGSQPSYFLYSFFSNQANHDFI
jgi:hypothetical protein